MGQPHDPGRGTGGLIPEQCRGAVPWELECRGGTGGRWGLPGVWGIGEGWGKEEEASWGPWGGGQTLTRCLRPGSMGGMLALPPGQGPHQVGCTDVMVGHTRQVRAWGQG